MVLPREAVETTLLVLLLILPVVAVELAALVLAEISDWGVSDEVVVDTGGGTPLVES